MISNPPTEPGPWSILRQFVRPRPPVERCELCGLGLAAEHPHLLESSTGQLHCCCDACSILFSNQQEGRYRRVPSLVASGNKFVLGEAGGMRRERTEQVATVLRESGFDVTVTDDIRGEVWTKLIGNAAFNPLSVIARARIDELMNDAGLGQIALRAMHEVAAVAAAAGAPSGMDIEKRYAINAELGAFRTSMLQDYEAGRTLELGGLVDAVVEIGSRLGVATPMTEALGAFARRAVVVRDRAP